MSQERTVMRRKLGRGMLLHQPWARMAAEGVFPVLVRPISTRARERVAIVARGTDPNALVDGELPKASEFPQPAIIGSVEIVDCVEIRHEEILPELRGRFGKEFARFYPRHYFPEQSPAYLWFLKNSRLLKRPKSVNPGGARVWIRL